MTKARRYLVALGTVLVVALGPVLYAVPAQAFNPEFQNARELVFTISFNRPLSLDRFWARTLGSEYYSVGKVQFYHPGSYRTSCGITDRQLHNAFYCSIDGNIYMDYHFMQQIIQTPAYNDGAVATIEAHEWGHHIQNLRGWDFPNTLEGVVTKELMADCFAGIYMRSAYLNHFAKLSDIYEGARILYWFGGGDHGTPKQRRTAFILGFNHYSVPYCEKNW